MPLHYLLYHCPECGYDPTTGDEDFAECVGCGRIYRRGANGGMVEVSRADSAPATVPIQKLVEAIDSAGGPLAAATQADGSIAHEAPVLLQRVHAEDPVYFRGDMIGLVESFGEPEEGVLRAREKTLAFLRGGRVVQQWNLLDLQALQTSSSTVQISPKGGGMVQFRFVSDSPRRWEELLKILLRKVFEEEGRGEIKEFQPRITTR